jgi:dolichol-phosphate mannosyltransferase
MSFRIFAILSLVSSLILASGFIYFFSGEWRLWLILACVTSLASYWAVPSRFKSLRAPQKEVLWCAYVNATSFIMAAVVGAAGNQSLGTLGSSLIAGSLLSVVSAGIGLLAIPVPYTSTTLLYVTLQLVLVKIIGASTINLLTEEAYYWKYAESLSYGYLDHPPVVALLIWLGERLLGTQELGVRLGALISWLLVVLGASLLTKQTTGALHLSKNLFVCSILPFTASIGFFMTPDAPLAVAWMFGLLFLHQVLFLGRDRAWWGVGIRVGLGLLSKYPFVLFGAAIPLFLLIDSKSRRWFVHPLPYCAATLGVLLFSPVIVWNYQHDWASFSFQSARRFAAEPEFSLHLWVVFLVVSATPFGAWFLLKLCGTALRMVRSQDTELHGTRRLILFFLTWSVTPLLAFGYASLTQEVKINWVGPAFLSLLPLLVVSMQGVGTPSTSTLVYTAPKQGHWFAMGLGMSAIVHAAIFYLAVGIPYLPTPKAFKKFLGWSELTRAVLEHEKAFTQPNGLQPVVAGGDSHYVASELGFYRAKEAWSAGSTAPSRTQGRALFGAPSLMYDYWSIPERHIGTTCLVVSRSEGDVTDEKLTPYFSELLPPERIEIGREGRPFAAFFLRVGRDYRPQGDQQRLPPSGGVGEALSTP